MQEVMYNSYVIQLTEENVPRIVEKAKQLGWTLDHLQDNLEVDAEDGFETWLYLTLFKNDNEIANFNDVALDATARQSFRLTDQLDPKFGIFRSYEKISERGES